MLYKPKYFKLIELVDKYTYSRFKEKAWSFLDPYALQALDNIREYFNSPVTVNTWSFGGDFQYRGFRPKHCDIGADYSFHRYGKAFDYDVKGVPAEEVRQTIIKNKDKDEFKLITCLEADVNWVHMDVRPIEDNLRILLVYP